MVVAENMIGCAMYELVRGTEEACHYWKYTDRYRSGSVTITWLERLFGSMQTKLLYRFTKRPVRIGRIAQVLRR